jgi:prepilin-type N-terminal cleavage/methylation domain-containing protein
MRKAFTLIELLVVIAIIAILAAILFPVFAKAKEAAKKTQDLNNQKQLALGIFTYSTDSDDVFPPAKSFRNWNNVNPRVAGTNHWSGVIFSYVKNWDIFVSPGDKLQGQAPMCYAAANNNRGKGAPPGQRADQCTGSDPNVPPEFRVGNVIMDNQAPRLSYTVNGAVIGRLRWRDDQALGGAKVVSQSTLDNVGSTIMIAGLQDNNGCVSEATANFQTLSGDNVNGAARNQANTIRYFGDDRDGTVTPLWALEISRIGPQLDACRTNPNSNYPLITKHSWNRWDEGDNYGMADGSAKFRKFGQTLAVNNYLWGARMYTARNQPLLDPITGNPVQQ